MIAWSNGSLRKGRVPIDSLNFSLQYSSPVVWEGIRSYKQDDSSTKIWKLKEHVERLLDSAKIVGFPIPHTISEIMEACEQVVKANGNGDLYLRPIAYSTQDAEAIKAQESKTSLDIYCFQIDKKPKKELKMKISNLVRGYPQYQMQAKSSANYGVLQAVKPELVQSQVDDVFLLDNLGYVTEATIANVFVVKGDVLMTPPNNGSILPGITRRCIAELVQDSTRMVSKYNKMPILIEKQITKADLYTADCVFLCGTYMELTNVSEIDSRPIGDANSKFYFKMLSTEYSNLVRGRQER